MCHFFEEVVSCTLINDAEHYGFFNRAALSENPSLGFVPDQTRLKYPAPHFEIPKTETGHFFFQVEQLMH